MIMPCGVIGNTPDSGSGILGSSPGGAAGFLPYSLLRSKMVHQRNMMSPGKEASFVPWCNGNTLVFGTSFPGSSPGGTALKVEGSTFHFFLPPLRVILCPLSSH